MRRALILATTLGLSVAAVSAQAADPTPTYKDVKQILSDRCQRCHADEAEEHGVYEAAAGIKYDTADEIRVYLKGIMRAVAQDKSLPEQHATMFTDSERKTISAWYAAGAKTTP